MNTYTHVIVNALTNETQIVKFTNDEITEHENWVKQQTENQEKRNEMRQAVLAKLGLTADEVAALFG